MKNIKNKLSKKESKYWKDLWKQIKIIRSFKGKHGNLSKFIAEDRERH